MFLADIALSLHMEKSSGKKELLNCILLVDDDPISLLISYTILTEMKIANKVIPISDGYEAIDFLAANTPPALILVDIQMHGKSSMKFISEVNKHAEKDKIKIVGLASSLKRTDKDKFKNSEILDYIVKPLTEEKISKILERNALAFFK